MKSKTLPFYLVALVAISSAYSATFTWDITDSTNQTIDDGTGTWESAPGSPLLTWNDEILDNANIDWNNTLHSTDTAIIGAGGTGGIITVNGSIQLAALTFNTVTGSYTIADGASGAFTSPGGTLTVTNTDTGNDRRLASGASIGANLTGTLNVDFTGAGDNVALTNNTNDFTGEIRISGGGLSVASDGAFGNPANNLFVKAAGGNLRNTAAITVNRDLTFDAGTNLGIVNSGNVLTLEGDISGGDAASVLNIGAGHGNAYNHNVRLTGTNTMAGTIRIYNVLRAYEGAGLSPNANITLGDYFDFGASFANTCGFLETSGNFVRALGTAAGEFQWAATGNYRSGGFSAVGDTLTVSFGGLATPASLTWNTTTGFIKSASDLRLQNASATHDLIWKNPINLANAARVIYSNSPTFPAIIEGVISSTTTSGGITKEGTGTLRLAATNTYTGPTTITAGAVEATTLANGGLDSSIGASSNAATNLVFGAASATLRYTGTSDVTIDRGFTTSSGTAGGATIQSSGTGTLSLDNTVPIALGTVDQTRTLTLSGTNTGANTFSKVIANNGTAATSLSKTGTGTWIINGANTFTGTANISGGTLVAANVSAFTNATSIGISTTTGSGTLRLATDTSVDAIKIGSSSANPGTIISDRATPGAGINHVLGTVIFGRNTYSFQAGANVTSGTAGVTLGTISLAAGSPGGTTVLNPTTAVLTLAGDISSTTTLFPKTLELGGTSTGNVVSGAISNGNDVVSVTKSNTSTWTLSGANSYSGDTTVSGGTLSLTQINASNESSTVSIASGAILDLAFAGTDTVDKLFINGVQQAAGPYTSAHPSGAFTGGGTLQVTSGPPAPAGFASWITGTFANGTVPGGQQGANDDPDNDGISNLVEYAVAGLDPTVSNGSIGTFSGLTLTFTKRSPLASDISYTIETSPDLQPPWSPQVTHGLGNTDPTISYTLPSGGGNLFARLKVQN